MSPNAGGRGGGGVAGSQPMSTAVHRSPNKLWRYNSIFNLCLDIIKSLEISTVSYTVQLAHVVVRCPKLGVVPTVTSRINRFCLA